MSIKDRGFASTDNELRTRIAGNGGKKAHALGRARAAAKRGLSRAALVHMLVIENLRAG